MFRYSFRLLALPVLENGLRYVAKQMRSVWRATGREKKLRFFGKTWSV